MSIRLFPDTLTVDGEMSFLTGEGYTTGTLNDKIYAYLGALGYTGATSDRLYSWGNASVPSVSGSISDQNVYRAESGTTSISVGGAFTGSGLTYFTSTPIPGLSLSGSNLVVDRSVVPLGNHLVIVWACNSLGIVYAEPFTLTVNAPQSLTKTQRWGVSTATGAGALDTNVISGGPVSDGSYTAFDVTSGIMTPNGGTIPTGAFTVDGISFTGVAGVKTVSTKAELLAAIADGATIELRGETAGGDFSTLVTNDLTDQFNGFTTETTLRQADSVDMPQIPGGIAFISSLDNNFPSNITLDGLYFFKSSGATIAKYNTPTTNSYVIQLGATSAARRVKNFTIQNCDIASDMPIARIDGLRPGEATKAIYMIAAEGVTIQQNRLLWAWDGVTSYGGGVARVFDVTIDDNDYYGIFDDGIHMDAADSTSLALLTNLTITNNRFWFFIGDNGYHMDGVHLPPATGATGEDVSNVILRGNIVLPGIEGMLAPAWATITGMPSAKSAPLTTNTSPTSGTPFHIDMDPTGGDLTVTLANADPTNPCAIQLFGRSGNTVTIKVSGDVNFSDPDGNTVTSFDMIEPWEFIRADWVGSAWVLYRHQSAVQSLFTNDPTATGDFVDIVADHNLCGGNTKPLSITAIVGGTVLANTSAMPFAGTLNGTGRINSAAQGMLGDNGLSGFLQGSAITSAGNAFGTLYEGGVAETADNSQLAPAGSSDVTYTDFSAIFGMAPRDPNQSAQSLPQTIAEAVTVHRPLTWGTAKFAVGHGAGLAPVGEEANDLYNFGQHDEALGFRQNTPWYPAEASVTLSAGGFTATFRDPIYSFGAISARTVEYRVNGGSWTAATVSGSGTSGDPYLASYTGGSISDVVDVRIYCTNANGAGTQHTDSVTVESLYVGPVTGTDLAAIYRNGVQTNSKTVTTTTSASGSSGVLVTVATRVTGSAGVLNTLSATLDGTSMTLLDSQVSTLTPFQLSRFWIASTDVPSGTFDVIVSNATANFNGVAIRVQEMANAADDQSTAASGTITFSAGATSRTPTVTTTAANSYVDYAWLGQVAFSSTTGATEDDPGTTDSGNAVTFAGFAHENVVVAGAADATCTMSSSGPIAASAQEILQA